LTKKFGLIILCDWEVFMEILKIFQRKEFIDLDGVMRKFSNKVISISRFFSLKLLFWRDNPIISKKNKDLNFFKNSF